MEAAHRRRGRDRGWRLISLKLEDEMRVNAALACILEAQRQILTAGEQLSPLPDFAPEWKATVAMHGSIKRLWHRVEAKRQKLTRNRLINVIAGDGGES